MLYQFTAEGFKCFGKKLEFRLDHTCSYEFNSEAVRNDIVNKGIIYGFNGCGKSNLGLAIFDIVSHLTDNSCAEDLFKPYLCLDTDSKMASFCYRFRFQEVDLEYSYRKSGFGALTWESLSIDGREMLQYDFETRQGFVRLDGAETLNLNAPKDNMSRVKYVDANAALREGRENGAFLAFTEFVKNMLLFYSLDTNRYLGFKSGSDHISDKIIREGKVQDFEKFLRDCGVNMDLSVKDVDGKSALMVRYKNAEVSFYSIASRGTKSLALFYYWHLVMEQASFVFMDEFDAFYHFELAEHIVKLVKRLDHTQIILTTHNTDLLSNDLLRPDCFFWMDDGKISPLCQLTDKELRKAHNLQKMFKAGAFNG